MSAARAAVAVAAVIASFCLTYALCGWAGAQAQPAIVAALFAITLSRRALPAGGVEIGRATLRLVVLALLTAGVGWLFHLALWLGAVVFVAAMSLSIWLRQFGERARSAGTVIALPLVALLVVPGGPAHARGGPVVDLALAAAAGVVALVCVAVVYALARRAGVLPGVEPDLDPAPALRAPRKPRTGLTVHTRMALQLAVALGAAFAAGFAFFGMHWGWCVLTAFIVCSGARGRGDAVYTGMLRLAGALGGSVLAAIVAIAWAPAGVAEACAIFVALFFALWLRECNYAYWAGAMTLIFALLARTSAPFDAGMLVARLEAIFAGAVCAVVAAWFVTPITTEAVIRRRLADALLALDDVVVHAGAEAAEHARRLASFEHHMNELERAAPPVRWHRRLFAARVRPEHPAHWIDLAGGLRPHAHSVATHRNRGAVRRAIGASRRAIAQHGAPPEAAPEAVPVTVSLTALHETLRSDA